MNQKMSDGDQNETKAFFVSPLGNDAWSGTRADVSAANNDGPFATLERAQAAIRMCKQEPGGLPCNGMTVYLRGGTYERSASLKLTAADSGAAGADIVWRAYPDERPCLTGSRRVTDFTPVTEAVEADRIAKAARGKLVQLDLTRAGITDYGDVDGKAGPGLELFCNGERMTLAPWPKAGWLQIADVPQTGATCLNEGCHHEIRDGIRVGRHGGVFRYDVDRPARWSRYSEVLMHGFWTWDWSDSYQRIDRIDTVQREIAVREPHHGYGYTKGQRFRFLNVLEELDRPGEWCIDRERGLIFFWPPIPLEQADVRVSMLDEPIMDIEGADHVVVRELDIELTRDRGIVIGHGSRDCLIAACRFRCLGGFAAWIQGSACGITGCDIADVSSGGIGLGGGECATLSAAGNFATNNHIHDFSKWLLTGRHAVSMWGVGNRAAHNKMHDAPHEAMCFGGNDLVIEYNEIYRVCLETGDAGAIHAGRDWTWRDNIIRHNYFHDIEALDIGEGQMSVYLDDFLSGTLVYGNIFRNAGQAVFIGGGRNNTVENNVFIECRPAVHVDARGVGWARYYFTGPTENGLVTSMKKMNYRQPPFSERYPVLLDILDDEPALPKYNRVTRNISIGGMWLRFLNGVDLAMVEVRDNIIASDDLGFMQEEDIKDDVQVPRRILASELAGNLLVDDVGLEDTGSGVVELRPDSPAWRLGFKRIPVERIGLQLDEYRRSPALLDRGGPVASKPEDRLG